MLGGTFRNTTVIHFARPLQQVLQEELADHHSVLLVGGTQSYQSARAEIRAALTGMGITVHEVAGVKSNPTLTLVQVGVELCRQHSIDFVLGVGGGSVIDSAKAIALGASYAGSLPELAQRGDYPSRILPLGAIVTLPGTGSESSDAAVVADEAHQKLVWGHGNLRPRFALLNPELTITAPLNYRLYGIVDAMSHIWERYFSPSEDVLVSTELCEGLLRALLQLGTELKKRPTDLGVSAEVMWACKLAHDNTVGFGRKQDWSSHKIAHALAARRDAPHGALLAVVFPAWMDFVSQASPAAFQRMGQRVFGVEGITQAIQAYRATLQSWGMPQRLGELGVPSNLDIFGVAQECVAPMASKTIGNFHRLSSDDIMTILKRCL